MMSLKTRLLAAMALVALAPAAPFGCGGNECASGTIEKDGQCVTEAVCGDGTSASNGKCVVDTSGCGAGTQLDANTGKCAPTASACGTGLTFDVAAGKCIPNTALTCGGDTTAQGNICIPSDRACGAGTQYTDGQCVVAATACGANTQLDANSGSCVTTDTVCGANTAFSGGTCQPIESVCATGTTFNSGMGVCLPEATCRAGDVVLNGQCVRPIEETAANADINESENNDPSLGGIANALDLSGVAAGGKLTVAGTIGAPIDLDNDATPDQDVDVFRVNLTAGQYVRVTLQPVGDVLPVSFEVNGVADDTAGYERDAAHGSTQGVSRQIVATATGQYDIRVAPSVTFATPGVEPVGSASARYVLTVEPLAAPTPKDFDTTANNPLTGSFFGLTDNVYKLTNLTGGEKIDITINSIGPNVGEGLMLVWSDPQTLVDTVELSSANATVELPPGEAFISLDWASATGVNVGFDITVDERVLEADLGTIAADTTVDSTPTSLFGDESYTFTFTANPGQVLVIEQDNTGGVAGKQVEIAISNEAGDSVFSSTVFDAISTSTASLVEYAYVVNGDAAQVFTVVVTNKSATTVLEDLMLRVSSVTPTDLGSKAVGDTIDLTQANPLTLEQRDFYRVTFSDNATLTGQLQATGAGDPDLYVYNAATGAQVLSRTATGTVSLSGDIVLAGSYVVAVAADTALDAGYTASFALAIAPTPEIEPNDMIPGGQAINLGEEYFGQANNIDAMGNDTDYFSFTPATTDVYIVSTTASSSCARTELIDGTGEILDRRNGTTGSPGAVLQAGVTYQIRHGGSCSSTTGEHTYRFSVAAQNVQNVTFDITGNDNAAAAQAFPGVEPIAALGTIESAVDEDWYVIQRNSDGAVRIQKATAGVSGIAAPHSGVTVEVFDSSQTAVTGTSGGIYNLFAGTYYVKVSGYNTSFTGNTYRLNVLPAPILETEPNNTIGTATPVNDLTREHGGTTYSINNTGNSNSDPDFWAITITTPTVYDFVGTVTASSAAFCMRWALFDDQGAEVFNTGTSGSGFTRSPFLLNGTYYLRADGWCSSTAGNVDYGFTITEQPSPYDGVDLEPNDTSAQAQDLRATQSLPLEIIGEISAPSDAADFYRVTLTPGTYSAIVGAQPSGGAPHAGLTATIVAGDGVTDLGSTGVVVTTAGDYFIKVEGYAIGETNAYVVNVLELAYAASSGAAIDTAVVTSTITVPASDTCIISGFSLYLNITHEYRGDMDVTLTASNGATYDIFVSSFDSAEDYIGFVPGDFAPVDSLSTLSGVALAGSWTLTITDTYTLGDVGVFNSWALLPSCQ